MNRQLLFVLCVFPVLVGQQCMEPLPQSSGTPLANSALPQVTLHTNQGEIVVELFTAQAPIVANMFKEYLEQGYYDNTVFHQANSSLLLGGRYRTSLTEKIARPTDSSELGNGLTAKRGRFLLSTPTEETETVPELAIVLADEVNTSEVEYTVIGRIISGMSVAETIGNTDTESWTLDDGSTLSDLPSRPISVNDPDLDVDDYTDPENDSPEDENGAPTDDTTAPDTTPPTVRFTTPTSDATYATSSDTISIGGTASDNIKVSEVTWSNDRGGSGTCTGTTTWSQDDISLESGENVITVTATDKSGNSGTDTLTVTYTPRDPDAPVAAATVSRYVVPGVGIGLDASESTDPNEGTLTYQWRQVSGTSVTLYDDTAVKGQYIAPDVDSDTDLTFELTVRNELGLEDVLTVTQTVLVKPKVRFDVKDYDYFVIELLLEDYPEGAPITVKNFAQYVEDGYYNNIIFHRVIDGFMIQTGAYEVNPNDPANPSLKEGQYDPIPNEFSEERSNVQKTVAMATSAGDPDSGTSQFFINMVDNTYLDDDQHTVFARVVEGWDSVDAISGVICEPNNLYNGEISYPGKTLLITSVVVQP